ncbi:MAG TPA: site-2 protease family protein [Polyangiaceae bacterium]|nr:site-2 protease family protein [Polyangiaceae bacterium]
MRWSWKLGEVSGIGIYMHASFLLLLVWVAASHWALGHSLSAAAGGLLLIVSVFATVVLHELGHALTARRFGIRTRDITLLPIGGVARLERMPDEPIHELLVALAGPAVNIGIALVLFGVIRVLQVPTGLEGLRVVGGPFLTKLLWINLSLAAFNLLPAFPMDGGRVLRAGLAMRMTPERATETAARLGQAVALALGFVGLMVNPMLVVIAVFVWMGAAAESSTAKLKTMLGGMTVRQAMITDFRALEPTAPIRRAVELTLSGFQQDFPVVDGTEVVGVVSHGDVLKALAERGPEVRVHEIMHRSFETAVPTELADAAFTRLQGSDCPALVVLDDGRLVGLVTPGNIGELLVFDAALGARAAARAREVP